MIVTVYHLMHKSKAAEARAKRLEVRPSTWPGVYAQGQTQYCPANALQLLSLSLLDSSHDTGRSHTEKAVDVGRCELLLDSALQEPLVSYAAEFSLPA